MRKHLFFIGLVAGISKADVPGEDRYLLRDVGGERKREKRREIGGRERERLISFMEAIDYMNSKHMCQ